MTRFHSATLLLALALSLGACGKPDEVDLGGDVDVINIIPQDENLNIDLLFVIDNSGSMSEEQASLVAWAQASLFDTLDLSLDTRPNLHIGVVSTDLGAGEYHITGCSGAGDSGVLQNIARRTDCVPPSDRFLRDVALDETTRDTNYTGTLGEAFGCIAALGIGGCGFEQPLEAMRRALDGSNPENAGFLRDDALLAVVFVTDEDDCSAADSTVFDPSQASIADPLGPLSSFRCFEFGVTCDGADPARGAASYSACEARDDGYLINVRDTAAFLKGLKADPNDVFVMVVAGAPAPISSSLDASDNPQLDPSCETANGVAYPPLRIMTFLDEFSPARRRVLSICDGSADVMKGPLEETARLVGAIAGRSHCLTAPVLDTEPGEGVQAACRVFDAVGYGTPAESLTEIPQCTGGSTPCFTLVDAPSECAAMPSRLKVDVNWGAKTQQGSLVVACRTE